MDNGLHNVIARILTPSGATAGTGFVVTQDGLIATCAHVVVYPDAEPDGVVHLIFPADGNGDKRQARIEQGWLRSAEHEDVAILRLEGPLPPHVTPLPLGGSSGLRGEAFTTFGFPPAKLVEGLAGQCEIIGETTESGFRVLQLRSQEVTPGFSGAPLLDSRTRRIVGMVSAITPPDQYGRGVQTAFAIFTETLQAICPVLQPEDVCPYRSLDAFTENDARFFFGRESVVSGLLAHLRLEPNFLAVLGPSGSGKSSLVRAGLIPRLRQGGVPGSEGWGIVVTRPAEFPALESQGLPGALDNLVGAVGVWRAQHPEQTRLVLVIDQYEELFRTDSAQACQAFEAQLIRLLEAHLPVTVILTMRDDFYARFGHQEPTLRAWLERGLKNVPETIEPEELRAIVEEPARSARLGFEPGLVEEIVRAALEAGAGAESGEPAARSTVLPLLEFALTQLWRKRQDGMMTHADYAQIDGVTGSLTQWADATYYNLETELQPLAADIFIGLIHLGDESQGTPDTRQRRPLEALSRSPGERETVYRMVLRLADARLLTTARDSRNNQETVEIVHDTLLREWALLKDWIKKDRRFLVWRQELDRQAHAWIETDANRLARRDPDRLLRGRDLTAAQGWLLERGPALKPEQQQFINTGLAFRDHRHRRSIALYAATTLAFATLFVGTALLWRRTYQLRELALSRQLATQANLLLGTQPQTSLLLAELSMEHVPTWEADQVLREGLAIIPEHFPQQPPYITNQGIVWAVAFSPNGHYLATAGADGLVHVWYWHAAIWTTFGQPLHCDGRIFAVGFSADGHSIYTASEDGLARTWDWMRGTETRKRLQLLDPRSKDGSTMVHVGAFSPDGHYIAVGSTDGIVQVWDWKTEKPSRAPMQVHQSINRIAFSPDGHYLATAGSSDDAGGHTANVWDLATGKSAFSLSYSQKVFAVAFSPPDGKYLATADEDGSVHVSDWSNNKEMALLKHPDKVTAMAFSPDSNYLATACQDNSARVWSWRDSPDKALSQMVCDSVVSDPSAVGPTVGVRDVAFSPDGNYVATTSGMGAWAWKAVARPEITRLEHSDIVRALAFRPGQGSISLATAGDDRTARIWSSLETETEANHFVALPHSDYLHSLAFSPPNGKYLATASGNTATVWDWTTDKPTPRQLPCQAEVSSVAFSPPDGKYLAIASGNAAYVWDWQAEPAVTIPLKHNATVNVVAFSPNGQYLVAGYADSTAQVWEWRTSKSVALLKHPSAVNAVGFDPDDNNYLATASGDAAYVWDWARNQKLLNTRPDEGSANATRDQFDVLAVAFSPDGKYLGVAGGSAGSSGNDENNLATVYEWRTGTEVVHVTASDSVQAIAFNPDETYLATASDNTAFLWYWRPADLKKQVRTRVTRNLTPAEWDTYLPRDLPYHKVWDDLP